MNHDRQNRYVRFDENGNKKRYKVTAEKQENMSTFIEFIKQKFNLNEVTKLEYMIKDETDSITYAIDNDEDFQEVLDDFENIKLFVINKERVQSPVNNNNHYQNSNHQENNNNYHLARAQNAAIAKLAINDVPFVFNGKSDDNIHHFRR